jgi:hypothetical protein
MLNDRLERKECAKQINDFYEAGWGALITRTFNGLRTPYLGEEWMEIIQETIERAGELGLKVWLQAGYMPSGIPDLPESQTHKVLVRKGRDESAEDGEILLLQAGEYAYYRRLYPHVLDLLNKQAAVEYLHDAYKIPWWDRFADAFGSTVETIWVDEPHFRPPYLPWNDDLPQVFAQKWGYSLIEELPALYAQTGDYQQVRHHYWRTVVDMLIDAYFAEVGRWCEDHGVKFGGHAMGEDSLYRQICWTGAAMRCYEHMQLPGIDHLTLSLTWPNDNKFIYTPKQCASAANQLGREQILAEMYGVSSQRITFEERKQVGDWLALLGITYRCYHGSFYSMRGVRKRIYDPHLSYQQPWWSENRLVADYFGRLSYALRQGTYGADVLVVHPVESAFCDFDPAFEDLPGPRVVGRRTKRTLGPAPLVALNQSFQQVSENLLDIHRGFEYGDEHLMALHGNVVADGLAVGNMTYQTVILPSVITLRRSTVELLTAFMDAGGTVLSAGELPTRIDGREDSALQDFNRRVRQVENSAAALRATLDELTPSSIEVSALSGDPAHVWVHERRSGGERIFFLANTGSVEPVDNPTCDVDVVAEVRIRGAGKLERWDLRTGEVQEIAQRQDGAFTVTRLDLPLASSHLLVLREGEAPVEIPVSPRAITEKRHLLPSYAVRRHSPNALTLDACRCRKGEGPWSEVLPVIAVQEMLEDEGYDGPVTLQFTFQAETVPRNAQVVIEDAAEYGIQVNGQDVAYAGLPYYYDRSFHPVDITEQVQAGENVIEISRRFEPPAKADFRLGSLFVTHTGVELEAIYLTGDFGVKGTLSAREERPRCVRYTPEFVLTEEAGNCDGNLIAAGYPFFAGRLSLLGNVVLRAPEEGERVLLTLPNLDVPLAKVRVNGQEAGTIAWRPYQVDIAQWVRDGENEVEVELITSLRNLTGPHHRLDGERDDTWGNQHYSGRAQSGPDWYKRRDEPGVEWTDDYFVLQFGLKGQVAIEYVSVTG